MLEKEIETCSFLCNILQREGLDVEATHDMTMALDLFTKKNADIILADFEIFETGGMEFLEKLQKCNPDVRIITMISHGSIDSYLRAMAVGAFEYLQKPIQVDLLHGVIKKALNS